MGRPFGSKNRAGVAPPIEVKESPPVEVKVYQKPVGTPFDGCVNSCKVCNDCKRMGGGSHECECHK